MQELTALSLRAYIALGVFAGASLSGVAMAQKVPNSAKPTATGIQFSFDQLSRQSSAGQGGPALPSPGADKSRGAGSTGANGSGGGLVGGASGVGGFGPQFREPPPSGDQANTQQGFTRLTATSSEVATTVVPLPPAAWSGLAMLGALGGGMWVRRRCRGGLGQGGAR